MGKTTSPLIHDKTNRSLAFLLAEQSPPDGPMAMGVLYESPDEIYQTRVREQINTLPAAQEHVKINDALRDGTTWTVK